MKKVIYTICFLAVAPILAFGVAGLTALPIMKADGKTFYEIISSAELILRFAGAGVIFGTLVYLLFRLIIRFEIYLSDYE